MFQHLSVGKKIALGFASLIGLSAALGSLAVVNMRSASRSAQQLAQQFVPETEVASRLEGALAQTQLAIRSYGFTADQAYLATAKKSLADTQKALEAARNLAEKYPDLQKLRKDVELLDALLREFSDAVAQTEEKNKHIQEDRTAMNTNAAEFSKRLNGLRASQVERLNEEIRAGLEASKLSDRAKKIELLTEVGDDGSAGRVAIFKAQALRDATFMEDSIKSFGSMDGAFDRLTPLLHVPADIEALADVKKAAHSYREAVENLRSNYLALEVIGKKRAEIGSKLIEAANDVVTTGIGRTVQAADSASASLSSSSSLVTAGSIAALLIGAFLATVISRGTTRILTNISELLDESATQVAAAATQVSGASQSLAEGASEQAASLEETSASLEEMSSMTQRNAENAQTARQLANDTRTAADSGSADMKKMMAAMDEIKSSSDNIGKIIKTIDEIAFQTNILALNAAVEAARAGEAGMGFAVVADEVRHLAQRSAQAAHETAERIEDSIRKSEQGVQISGLVAESLGHIVHKAREVDQLVSEIATASREQSQGIKQVNTAVTQMDKVTQSNAASAEESASASEELNAQAASLKDAVNELVALVGGRIHNTGPGQAADRPLQRPPARSISQASRSGKARANGHRSVTLNLDSSDKEAELPMQGVN